MHHSVQKFRGGFAVSFYEDGSRIGRRRLTSVTFDDAKIEAETFDFIPMPDRSQAVYFLQIMNADRFIKIGLASRADRRMRELLVGIPYALELLKVCPGGRALERELHRQFSRDRVRGEWFRPTSDLLTAIETTPGVRPTVLQHADNGSLWNAVLQQLDLTKKSAEGAQVLDEPGGQHAGL